MLRIGAPWFSLLDLLLLLGIECVEGVAVSVSELDGVFDLWKDMLVLCDDNESIVYIPQAFSASMLKKICGCRKWYVQAFGRSKLMSRSTCKPLVQLPNSNAGQF